MRIPEGPNFICEEMRSVAEIAAGKSASRFPRLCIPDAIYETNRAVNQGRHIATLMASRAHGHVQPFLIDEAEWKPEQLIYPKNSGGGCMNGLVGPFIAWLPFCRMILQSDVIPMS